MKSLVRSLATFSSETGCRTRGILLPTLGCKVLDQAPGPSQ